MEIPEDEVEDLLAYFAKEKGYIPKAYYDDYILANCISNINQLLHKLGTPKATGEPLDIKALRADIIALVLDHNPLLKYDNVIINKNRVLKLKKGRMKKGEKLLKNNKYWESKDPVAKDDKEQTKDLITKVVETYW
jgi:hypothetical protein